MAKNFNRLTRGNIRKLKAGQSITEHGITFERLRNGDGRYSVNVMVDGIRIHRVIGRETERTTRSQAEQFIEQVRTDAKHDRLNLPKARKMALLFRDAAVKYLERLEKTGGKDIKGKASKLVMHLKPFFGNKPLGKISTFDIERYKRKRLKERAIKSSMNGRRNGLKDTTVTPATVNRELAVLSHLLGKAVEWNWLGHRPAKIERLKEDNTRITYLTRSQASALVEAAKGDQNAQIYPFVRIGLETSMRLSEILSIRKENVDLDNRRIYIPKAKAGAREQPITTNLAEYLQTYIPQLPAEGPWLFPSERSKTGHTVNINKPFRRVVQAAGLDPEQVVRHTLRHTAITHLVQAGVDLPTVKRISGHKTLQMVERYAHANGKHIQVAMDMLEKRLRTGS